MMSDYSDLNLRVQRGRIVQAVLEDLYAHSTDKTQRATAWAKDEFIAEDTGSIENFIDQCIAVNEVKLRVRLKGARFGTVTLKWGLGTGRAISDYSPFLDVVLEQSLSMSEFLNV